jgi:transposase InsO family protein
MTTSHCSTWMIKLTLQNRQLPFKLDTGAEVTAINEEAYSAIGRPELITPNKKLHGPSQQTLSVKGQFSGKFSYGDIVTVQTVYVIEELKSNLLGLPAITAMKLIARMDTVCSDSTWKEIFPSVFNGLGTMGSAYEIKLKPNAQPFALFTARRIPIPLRQKVSQELEKMETLGVISKVDQPTPWCAGMVVVPKKNCSIRICVDLKPLNVNVLREVHPLPSVDNILAQLSGAKIFSKLDANSGFWQVPLSANSRLLTTFITPFGRYCFNKLPFGIASAPEVFQKRMNRLLEGLEGTVCLIDDILIFARTQEEHKERLTLTLQRLQEAGVTLNWEKCEFLKTKISFLGHLIDQDGIKPDPNKTSAICQMSPPKNVTELRRFMGMVNQLGKFSSNLSELSQPLRKLLCKKVVWQWTCIQEQAFDDVKRELVKPSCLALYNPQNRTKVSADASSYGLGAALLQEVAGQWKPVVFASRSMSETEQRYAQIEKEALAATWACEKFSSYLLGLNFTIETDHKPLVPLLGMKNLDCLPPRILRFRLRLDRFDYTIVHVPGKLMYTADTLSRAPATTCESLHLQELAEEAAEGYVEHLPASQGRLEEYSKAQTEDQICAKIIEYCMQGWPKNIKKIDENLRVYWKHQSELSICKGILLLGRRIVVPRLLQKETLLKIHEGHQGIERCCLRARNSVWWPEMSQQIKDFVTRCPECVKISTPNREPLIIAELPDYPWQRIATDLFMFNGTDYLLVVDYFSRYPEIIKLSSTNSLSIITGLKSIFSRHGIPETVMSDNGPQYTSKEFKEFAKCYNFTHITSSPHYPQSNGQAERTVRTVKRLLQLSKDPYMALLHYRSTPFPWCNLSPAELLMGRNIRTTLPRVKDQLIPEWKYIHEFRICNRQYKELQKKHYDSRHRVRELPPIPDGSSVWIKTNDQKIPGIVSTPTEAPRSYVVENSGGQLRRNRRHLTVIPENEPTSVDNTPLHERSPIKTRLRTNTNLKPPDRFIPGREM